MNEEGTTRLLYARNALLVAGSLCSLLGLALGRDVLVFCGFVLVAIALIFVFGYVGSTRRPAEPVTPPEARPLVMLALVCAFFSFLVPLAFYAAPISRRTYEMVMASSFVFAAGWFIALLVGWTRFRRKVLFATLIGAPFALLWPGIYLFLLTFHRGV